MTIVLTKKVVKVGGSLGVIFDKSIMQRIGLLPGDYIEISIKKIDFKDTR